MNAGSSQHQVGRDPSWQQARRAAWCTVAGIIVGLATLICSALRAVSSGQAIAMSLPAVTLIIGGLVAGAPRGAPAGWRLGYKAGFQAGSFVRLWRSLFDQRRR